MLTQLSPPSAEPLTLAEAKLHLRVDADITDDDSLISALIVTARQQAEHRTGRALVTQQWRYSVDTFPADSLEMPLPKLQSVQALISANKLHLVQPAIDAIADPVQRAMVQAEWDKSQDFERARPTLIALATAIGLDAAGLDALFIAAEDL